MQWIFLCYPLDQSKFFTYKIHLFLVVVVILYRSWQHKSESSHTPFRLQLIALKSSSKTKRSVGKQATVWHVPPACLEVSMWHTERQRHTQTQTPLQCPVIIPACTHRPLKMKKKRSQPLQRAHCLVCPALCFVLHWMALHSWLDTQIDFVSSHYEQDSTSVNSLLQLRDSQIQILKSSIQQLFLYQGSKEKKNSFSCSLSYEGKSFALAPIYILIWYRLEYVFRSLKK